VPERRLLGYFPQLERRSWEDAAPELSRFLRRLFDSEGSGLPSGFGDQTPEEISADGTAGPGAESDGWASVSHDHPVSVGTAIGLGNASAEGVDSSLSRSDHIHKRDVRVRKADSDVATRNALNFLDSSVEWTVNDDLPNDEVEISGTLSVASRTFAKGGTLKNASAAADAVVWEAPFAATLLAVRGVRVGGTAATVNARKNFTSEHLASDLSLPAAQTVYDGGAVQNASYAAGDILEARVKSVSGPSDVTVIIRIRRD
jgi:hypothetical protein